MKTPKTAQMTVEVDTLVAQNYQVMVSSFGTVKPRTESLLVSQASGQIVAVDDQFRGGGFFEKGDVLVQLDDRDHKAEVKVSQAALLSATQVLLEEEARVQQAKADWLRLGNGKEANALVLREPQLAAAQAKVLSAEAQLDKAKLMLERTKIIAPYAGRILNKRVGLGQVVSMNTTLADIYAVDAVEIRLPIKNNDLPLIKLPEEYQDVGVLGANNDVELSSSLLGNQFWQGEIIRTESAIDELSQQLYVIAQVLNPYDVTDDLMAPIKIGQYVNAKIAGRMLKNVIVIPSQTVYQGSYVYVVENGVLLRKDIILGWHSGDESVVSAGLSVGDRLVITPLGQVSSGTGVIVKGEATAKGNNDNKLTDIINTMPEARRIHLSQAAKEKGITIEQLMLDRQQRREKKLQQGAH